MTPAKFFIIWPLILLSSYQWAAAVPEVDLEPEPLVELAGGDAAISVPDVVSLEKVCALALQHHPDMRQFPYAERAADAQLLIAQRLPNPSVSLEAEDLAGNGVYSGTQSAIYTAMLVQTLETGGKRGARAAEAEAGKALVEAEYQKRRRELLEKASSYFVNALAAKEALALADRELELAENGLSSVETQVEAGRATVSQRQLAGMGVGEAKLEQRRSRRGLERALAELATLWGGAGKPSQVQGSLTAPAGELPARPPLLAALENNPELRVARLRGEQATARMKMAQAGRYPDVDVGVGARHDRGSGDDALVVGLSVPLPLFESGRDAVRAARAEARAAEIAVQSARLDLRQRFEAAWNAYADGHDAAMTVEQELMPAAREVFSDVDKSYRLGRTTFLEWVEARRQLDTANRRWLAARRDFQQAAATLQALTGQSL